MGLPSKTQAQFVQDMVANWAAALGFQPTLSKGDPFLALMQAVSSQLVFLQALVQLVNELARVQTSEGADVDTWMAQFGFIRLPATFAEGPVTFTKLSPAASQVLIPPGIVVQTPGGAIQYETIADPAQPTWSVPLNAYVLAPGQTSLVASVEAVLSGSAYNVAANALSQIASQLPGIDQVNNSEPISNGINAESNTAFEARFVLFLNSLSQATLGAIQSAIAGVGQGIESNLLDNVNLSGGSQPGQFTAVIDNGTGSPPAGLVAQVQAAISAVRGFTINGMATAVTPVTPAIVLAIRVAAGFTSSAVQAAVANAVAVAANAQPIGGTDGVLLYISQIEGAALDVAGVVSCQPGNTKINGTAADLTGTGFQAVRVGVNNVTVGTY